MCERMYNVYCASRLLYTINGIKKATKCCMYPHKLTLWATNVLR